jgi:23S rRNA (adenine2503-C2)-methyltransferase
MTNVPLALREALEREVPLSSLRVEHEALASDGTEKALFETHDGRPVEGVLMRYRDGRRSLCLSSQSGCPLTCTFCATGRMKFGRNLTASEILDQALHFRRKEAVNHAVFMGMGEPLLNLDRVLAAVDALNDPRRFGLGARHITVSTSGVVPGIRRLTALGPQFTLAVSLHAARDPLRDVLVPLNRRWPVAEVVAAAREHAAATGRRVTYEATMIGGINDTEADAHAMADLLHGDHAHVNLIPMNPVAHTPWSASPDAVIERFAAILSAAGVTATIRRNRGQEIGAACGQLAAERAGEPPPAVVARRRARLVDESAHALRGERSDQQVPEGVVAATTGWAGDS